MLNKAMVIVGVVILGYMVTPSLWKPEQPKESKESREIINPLEFGIAYHLRTPATPGQLEAYRAGVKKKFARLEWVASDVERMLARSTDEYVLKIGREFQEQLPKWRAGFERVIGGDFSDDAVAGLSDAWEWWYWKRMTDKLNQGLTAQNYRKIMEGMTPLEVDMILGCSGVEQASAGSLKTYTWQAGDMQVVASFEDNRLIAKTQAGLK